MSSESSWIAPFIQQVLRMYLDQTTQDDIEVDEHGTNLIFKFRRHDHILTATVAEWGMGPSDNEAILMDTELSIDAIISNELLPVCKPDPQTPQSVPTNPKKYSIKLLDFKLVVPCAEYQPIAHLLINDLQIEWDSGPKTPFLLKKKLRKHKNVRALLDEVGKRVRDLSKVVGSAISKNQAGSSGPTQNDSQCGPLYEGVESQQIFSQVPRDPPRGSDHPENESRAATSYSVGANELLKRLQPKALAFPNEVSLHTTKNQIAPNEPDVEKPHVDNINTRVERQTITETISKIDNSSVRSPVAQSPIENLSAESISSQNSIYPQIRDEVDLRGSLGAHGSHMPNQVKDKDFSPAQNEMKPPLKKRQRESLDGQSKTDDEEKTVGSREHIPSTKRQRVGTPTEPSALALGIQIQKLAEKPVEETANLSHSEIEKPVTIIPPHNAVIPRSNPWEGFNKIRSFDVTISKDQRELLDSDKLCWIPPRPNEPMPKGHVPPSLLRTWNNAVERRHGRAGGHEAGGHEAISERPVTPTQDNDSSSVSSASTENYDSEWHSSPEPPPRPRQNDLPPSSPVTRPIQRKQQLSHLIDRSAPKPSLKNDSLKGPISAPNALESGNDADQDLPDTHVSEDYRLLAQKEMKERARSRTPLAHQGSPGNEEISHRLITATPAPNQQIDSKTPVPTIDPKHFLGAQENDSDDESVMDTSVPFALGETIPDPTQSSHLEEELVSSGPPLPGVNTESIQVAVTPKVGSNRLQHSSNPEPNERGLSSSNPSSSQVHKTSSQSRILDTYPFHASHDQSQSSHEASTPSGNGQEIPITVEVPGTQLPTSSIASQWKSQPQSQSNPNNSQADIVLDSSGPAQRHHDFAVSATQPSPTALTGRHEPAASQQNGLTQIPARETHTPSEPGGSPQIRSSLLPPLVEPDPVIGIDQFSHGDSDKSPQGNEEHGVGIANTQGSSLVARRQGFVTNTETYAGAQAVYKNYCRDYSSYSGDFDHFTKMCGMLHAVRQQGKLHRSFLWDDFIAMHLTNYPRYLEKNASQGTKTLSYEDYFLTNVFQPFFSKRSLTARGIELAASQTTPDEATLAFASSSQHSAPTHTQGPCLDISFTGSLIDKFTDLHANSFNAPSQGGAPTKFPGQEQPSSASFVEIKREGSVSDPIRVYNTQETCHEDPVTPASSLKSNSHQFTLAEAQNSTAPAEEDAEDIDMEIPETDPEDADHDTDLEDTIHETASVELGDESFVSSRAASHAEDMATQAIPAETIPASPEVCESESDNENWFLSLQHIRPKGPVWSDGPTEFKRWAEADQNVKCDRKRRGGAKIRLDDKGVIRRPIYR
ncbi:hypothetical protein N7451_008082 [Penicillium sp. IBT 35674x]|nr:hypothetical protein N7451_008082 [Penicillium sp. IBT 35674x]